MTNGIGRVGWRTYVSAAPTTASIITTGLVLNLDAGNAASYPGTGTTWTDLSGNGNTGTLVNGTSYSSANGGTMVFDGINDYVNISDSTYLDLPNTNTMEFWVNSNQLNNNDIISHRFNCYGAAYNPTYTSGYVAGKLSIYYALNNGDWQAVSTTTTPIIGQWYHLVGTYDGSTMKVYLNGVLENTRSVSGNITQNDAGLDIGSYNGSPAAFAGDGKISIVRYYHKTLSATEVLQNFNALKSRYGFTSYTTRTAAFATATGITDTTILNALNTFDAGLISNGLDTKLKALYPFVGGTSTTHKYNFMDARDLNAAFRLTFNGGWVHSSNGIQGNTINTFANTYFIPSVQLTLTSGHYSIYSRTNILQESIDLGVLSSNGSVHQILSRYQGNQVYSYASTNTGSTTANDNSLGHYITNRNSSTNTTGYKNGTKTVNAAQTAGLPTEVVFIGARNQGGSGVIPTSRQYAFASMGNGLTDTEASTLYTLTQALQTTLGRNV
jgi:hypothetical protein